MKYTKFLILLVTLLTIISLATPAVASPTPSCAQVGNGQWHIVNAEGGNQFFGTEAECLAVLEAVDPTEEPTEEPTIEPTEEPTEEPTAEPTEEPTIEPTVEPTIEPTDIPTPTPLALVEQPAKARFPVCQTAYLIFTSQVYKDDGFKILRNHPWCRAWMVLKYGYSAPSQP